jgi:hypothetical protein
MSIAARFLPSPVPLHKAHPLAAWSKGDVLALIADTIGRSYQCG